MREISESILLKNVYRIMIGGMDMSKEVERLQELIDQYDNIVFFGGAGVSTESAAPTCATRWHRA